jgi:hypothetical protein
MFSPSFQHARSRAGARCLMKEIVERAVAADTGIKGEFPGQ